MGKLKVLLVVANLELRRRLCGILGADGELDIVAEANNAYSARDKIIECNPEVMLLCHDLPRMPGIVFLEKLMPQRSIATLVVAESQYEDAAYRAGAKDFVPCGNDLEALEHDNICPRLKNSGRRVACSAKEGSSAGCQYDGNGEHLLDDLHHCNGGFDRRNRGDCHGGERIKEGYSGDCAGTAYAGRIYQDVCAAPR